MDTGSARGAWGIRISEEPLLVPDEEIGTLAKMGRQGEVLLEVAKSCQRLPGLVAEKYAMATPCKGSDELR